MILLVVGLLLFVGLVVVHEWGHFIMAKRNGVEVEEFGIGFPPRLYKRTTKGGWLFTINLLPLGGFVKLKGEHDADTEKGTFGAASTWAKTKIMAAGVAMNFITAFILLMIVALIGMPQLVKDQFTVSSDTQVTRSEVFVSEIIPNSPAEKAGLRSKDQLVSVGPVGKKAVPVKKPEDLQKLTKRYAGQDVAVHYIRDGTHKSTQVTLLGNAEVAASQAAYEKKRNSTKLDCANITPPKAQLGVVPAGFMLQRSTWSAPVVAGGLMGQFTSLTFQGLGRALSGLGSAISGFVTGNTVARQNGQCEASSQVAGPVGIFFVLQSGTLLGYQYILFVIAIISLTLAIMNFLPIPALDGGRLWLTLGFRAARRDLTQRTEEIINATGFILLIGLIILISVVDVRRFF